MIIIRILKMTTFVVSVLLLVSQEPGSATLDAGVNETTRRQESVNQPVQGVLLDPSNGIKVSQHSLEVVQGSESVLLPCVCQVNMVKAVVVWTHKSMAVYTHRQSRDDHEDQEAQYANRTIVEKDAFQSGNFSLTLTGPAANDSGNYTCTVREFGLDLCQTQVRLRVEVVTEKDPPNNTWIYVIPVAAVAAVAAAVAAVVYKKFFKKNKDVTGDESEMQQLRHRMVEVESGEESVLLPFGATPGLPMSRVEWKNSSKVVHVYSVDTAQPGVQDQNYRGRTEINNTTLDLTLRHPRTEEAGTFSCTVKDTEGTEVTWDVELKVKVAEVEVEPGEESVVLPYKTTPDLPEGSVVKWVWGDFCVYCYPHQEQQHHGYRDRTVLNEEPLRTGDLSLTLNHPTLSDAGTYTCYVFDPNGVFLREKTIKLVGGQNRCLSLY